MLYFSVSTSTPSPTPSSANLSLLKLTQSSDYTDYNDPSDFYSVLQDDNDNESNTDEGAITSKSPVLCCNAQLIKALKSPDVSNALSLLADPDVIEGLSRVKQLGAKNEESVLKGNWVSESEPRIKAHAQTSSSDYENCIKAPSQAPFMGGSVAQPNNTVQIQQVKVEPSDTSETFVTPAVDCGREVTADDFDRMGSPRKRKITISSTPKSPANKKFKNVNTADTSSENMILKTDIKKKAIKQCHQALKVVRPANDKDRIIYNTVKMLGRKMHFGPDPPHAFYKIVANMFPEFSALSDETKILKLVERLTFFISKNIEWTSVRLYNNYYALSKITYAFLFFELFCINSLNDLIKL